MRRAAPDQCNESNDTEENNDDRYERSKQIVEVKAIHVQPSALAAPAEGTAVRSHVAIMVPIHPQALQGPESALLAAALRPRTQLTVSVGPSS